MKLKKCIVKGTGFLLVLLIILFSLAGCELVGAVVDYMKPIPTDTTKWEAYKTELENEYSNIDSISTYTFRNSPTLFFDIKGDNLDLDIRDQICQRILDYVVSEEGYAELSTYYRIEARQEYAMDRIYMNFTDYQYSKKERSSMIEIYKEYCVAEDDVENMRGFVGWIRSYDEPGLAEKARVYVKMQEEEKTLADTPRWNAYKTVLENEYINVESISMYVFCKSITLFFRIEGDNLDLETREEISRRILDYVVSEEGYEETSVYYKEAAGWKYEFNDIYFRFIDYQYSKEEESSTIEINRDDSIAKDDVENMRGFVDWKAFCWEKEHFAESIDINGGMEKSDINGENK